MIELRSVFKQYGSFEAVKGISLTAHPGKIYGFLGPNGAGKTSTIRMITGIQPPSSGQILLDGIDVTLEPMHCRRITGYVPDRPYVYERLKAWEFLQFMAELYRIHNPETMQRAEELLALFRLDDARHRLIEDFSHGMKQKLVIVASLLHDPKILVIDEPMVGLDPKGAATLKELFRKLAQEGRTIFLSTHTMSVAEELCHTISIIHKGVIAATGSMKELKSQGNSDDGLEEIFLKITEEEAEQNAP